MEIINELVDFLNNSHCQYSAVKNAKEILLKEGFSELNESDNWELQKGKNYFVIRNMSSIIAFKIPKTKDILNFKFCASHTDSPALKIKEGKEIIENGYHKLEIESYGSLINSTWLDKPLSVSGRIVIKNEGLIESRIIDIDRDLMIIPNVCIHYNREINSGYAYSYSGDLSPIYSLGDSEITFKSYLAKYLNVDENQLLSYDLYLYNRQKATLGGLNNELLMSPKIDNLESLFISLHAFCNSFSVNSINVFASFDSEEIGSSSSNGADSTFMTDVVNRICISLDIYKEMILPRSALLSIDNAHATHPNHPEYSDKNNPTYMNKGVVIKVNANMSYTSDGLSVSLIKELTNNTKIPIQVLYNNSDVRGGSTLGKISFSHLSVLSCDIGLAQLAMHSNYEVAGTKDVDYMNNLVKNFYEVSFAVSNGTVIFNK